MRRRFSVITEIIVVACFLVLLLTGCGEDSTDSNGSVDVNVPVFNSIDDKTITPGESLEFTVLAIDPNGETITYSSAAVGTPNIYVETSANFNAATATFSWTSSNTDDGVYSVQFTATNTSQLSGTETIIISVLGLITQGRSLYESNCSNCHGTETATGSTFFVWQSTAAAIAEAIRLNQGGMGSISLTSDELAAIAAYLATVNP
ncbi:MAG: hypothetical protein GXP08_00630 [Gammaproteobacteria bacterium]|nr:hypothetical protein [Gammaproteobacteria bacterium]